VPVVIKNSSQSIDSAGQSGMAQASSIPLATVQDTLKRLKNAGTISEISVEPADKSGMTFLRIVFPLYPFV
jgi:hypothetical protein